MSPLTFATTLLTLVVDTYGTEAFNWDPETLRTELNDDFRIKIPDANFDRLMAAINLLTTDDFYKSLPDFINYCNVLCGDTYDPQTWDPADAAEIAWGITETLLIAPPDENDEHPFTDEILAYIAKALEQEGIITPPDILKIAARDIDTATVVSTEYSDDPAMYSAIYGFEAAKTDSINAAVRNNLQQLSAQLDALQLRNGSTSDVVQQMLQSLDNTAENTSLL